MSDNSTDPIPPTNAAEPASAYVTSPDNAGNAHFTGLDGPPVTGTDAAGDPPVPGGRPRRATVSFRALVAVAVAASLLPIAIQRVAAAVPTSSAAAGPAQPTDAHPAHAVYEPVYARRAATSGPLTALDKELLQRVRLADLWELPAGRLAQDHAASEQVKRAGQHLLDGHARLDQMVREMASALDVAIPDKPTAEQQGWLKKLESLQGKEFDVYFANVLREAHGKVFVIVATVRSTTQNSIIRDLAIEANRTVADHLEVLEDTDLVTAETLNNVRVAVVKPS